MILKSRQNYLSSDDFRNEFLETITPGVIKRADFIQWETIFKKTKKYNFFFDFFRQIHARSDEECITEISDGLMSADNASDIIDASFELLGHTGSTYVSNEDNINFKDFSSGVKDEKAMRYISTLLVRLGICNVLNLDIDDYFVGVQVGLETHRRKNVGGAAFISLVRSELGKLIQKINENGNRVILSEEETIYYSDGQTSKKVDFCLKCNEKKIGIEVNFYTSSGSKPTEIKRSYGLVNKELENVNTVLVWITDGIGYTEMKKSLKEARDIHKNIYNFNMMKKSFEADMIDFFIL